MTLRGVHVFTGRGGLTAGRAADLRAAHVRGVLVPSEAVDGWQATLAQAERWGRVCAGAGIAANAYAFPGLARTKDPRAVAQHLVDVVRALGGSVPMADVEGSYRRQPHRLVDLLDAIEELRGDLSPTAITTLGLPSEGGTWPWDALMVWMRDHPETWLAWQCYQRAGSGKARVGLSELGVHLRGALRVLPCVATYAREKATKEGIDGAARLVADLTRACLDDAGKPLVPGVILWSLASLEDDELAALEAWTSAADARGWLGE